MMIRHQMTFSLSHNLLLPPSFCFLGLMVLLVLRLIFGSENCQYSRVDSIFESLSRFLWRRFFSFSMRMRDLGWRFWGILRCTRCIRKSVTFVFFLPSIDLT
ncbi:unnamed protein product [Brassica napus]|uniref:(rape) hypothetical protein n=1 Tax=Brassica napus TaxID=3708 RepID=A0A816PTN7_BRANA|nr:unnamed protein product [Brassica napus]